MSDFFWQQLPKPIIALSPMDGVTDAAFRYINDTYGHPDILITEFTSVEGIEYGVTKLLEAFMYHQTDTPTIAQIYGSHPEAFYKATFIVCEMGFDGVDINMGCPDAAVARKGGGAALIRTPDLAKHIIFSVKKAIQDWSEGKTIQEVDLKPDILDFVKKFKETYSIIAERKIIPVSVKTRIGYEEIVTEEWMKHLLETEPVTISLHGRTLKQMYTGEANWEEIGKASEVVHETNTLFLGNGDVKSLEDAKHKAITYKTDGILIGRAAFGNPWIFSGEEASTQTRMKVALEHCQKFMEFTPEAHFLSLRKHLAWYTKGFDKAAEVRAEFMKVQNLEDIEHVMKKHNLL